MRLFVGIPLAEAVRDEISALTARLKSKNDGLRWSAPESWHITLAFLGNTGREQYECVAARLGELHLPPVPIALEKVELFARGGVLVVTVRPTPQLLQLQQRVSAAAEFCGFVPEARPYQPHITLARSSKGRGQKLTALKTKMHRQQTFSSFVAREFFSTRAFWNPADRAMKSAGVFRLFPETPSRSDNRQGNASSRQEHLPGAENCQEGGGAAARKKAKRGLFCLKKYDF